MSSFISLSFPFSHLFSSTSSSTSCLFTLHLHLRTNSSTPYYCTLIQLIRNCLIHTQASTLRLLLSTSFSSTPVYLLPSHPPNLTHTLTLLIHHPAHFTLLHPPKSHQRLFFVIHHYLSTFHPPLLIHHQPDHTPCHPHLASTPQPHSAIRIKYPPIYNHLIQQHLIHTLPSALKIHPSISVSSTNTSSTAVSPTLELHYRAL